MKFGLFRRSANETVIDRLYLTIVAASRAPALFADFGIPDTFEGRFESLTMHVVLVVRRLQACDRPGPDMAQHLIDTVFKHFDRTLREMGVGDTTVPKRMKTLAEAFLGRSQAYEAAFKNGSLSDVVTRNVYAGRGDDPAPLVAYIEASRAALTALPLQAFIDGHLVFPGPVMAAS